MKLTQDLLPARYRSANFDYMELYGHVVRLPVDDPAHGVIIAVNNPEWRRPIGRPHLTWMKQVDKIYRELLGMGSVQAWELAWRSPGEWSRRVCEATSSVITFLVVNHGGGGVPTNRFRGGRET